MQDTLLSSKYTNIGLYGRLIFTLFVSYIYASTISNRDSLESYLIIPLVILLGMSAFVIYLFKYVAITKIENNKLVFKKQFSNEESYPFKAIEKISSFRLKNTQYTTVTLKNELNTTDKYIIVISKSFIFSDKVDAKKVLRQIKREA